MSTYAEILGELKNLPLNNQNAKILKDALTNFGEGCQKFLWLSDIYNELEDAIKILKNYIEEGDGLANRKSKGNREKQVSLCIPSKLYIEFIYTVYNYDCSNVAKKAYFFKDIINNPECLSKIRILLNKYFKDESYTEDNIEMLAKEIEASITEWTDSYSASNFRELNMKKLHIAMKKLDELDIPMLSIPQCVDKLIVPEKLNEILTYLKKGAYVNCLFTIAPITRALTIGEIHHFTPDNTTVFINRKISYNCEELESYLKKLQDLYDEYTEIKNELDSFYKYLEMN